MVKYLKIGQYTPATDGAEAIIEREFYGQGYIFKDEEAYETSLIKPAMYRNSATPFTHTRIF